MFLHSLFRPSSTAFSVLLRVVFVGLDVLDELLHAVIHRLIGLSGKGDSLVKTVLLIFIKATIDLEHKEETMS